MNKKLTLLAFKNTSAELLVKGLDFSTVFLPSDKIKDSESHNPGTSYCNLVYWNSLNYIKAQKLNCKLLFIHIPYEKNIDNILTLQEKLNIIIKNI